MGGNATKMVSKKAVRSLKNIHFEERAHKKIDKHLKNPIVAPRHESTKDIIEKQVAGIDLNLFFYYTVHNLYFRVA